MKTRQEKMTLEKLAIMINNGFENARMENQKQHEEMKRENAREHEEIKKELKGEIQKLSRENSREHDDLKLRQDNVAYRFELIALEGRV